MRFVYFDIDTQRPDHLGCYGYHRDTSPTIDAIAAEGIRFDNVYASDTPCLPSRSALITGRFGIRNGAISHGGRAADPFVEGPGRGFQSSMGTTSWARVMRAAGLSTTTISTFGERHSAYHWYAGFNEVVNLGTFGIETADAVTAAAEEWLRRRGHEDNWFLHVHMWDPHTPYRTPLEYGDPFVDEPAPAWLTEEVRAAHWQLPGPHSAQETMGFTPTGMFGPMYPRQPGSVPDMEQVKRVFDGYDTGVRYADDHIGRLCNVMADLGVFDDAAILVSADHGESLGELGIYCDHTTADQTTARLPCVLRWPGLAKSAVDDGLHYQIDVAATILQLLGLDVPEVWDGQGFARALRNGEPTGRDHLVLSHAAWTAQRSVRFDDWLCIRTYHDGFRGFPPVMLFDLVDDPHEQHDLSSKRPEVVDHALALMAEWQGEAMVRSTSGVDPLWTVMHEGGPFHPRGKLATYAERLRQTGRGEWADLLTARHPGDADVVYGDSLH